MLDSTAAAADRPSGQSTADAVPPLNESEANAANPLGENSRKDIEAEKMDVSQMMNSIFVNDRPKHLVDGIAGGARNLLTGVGVGTLGLVTMPTAGAIHGGVKGFGQGLAVGLAGLVGLTGYGIYSAGRQVVRGVGNTPEAISAVRDGSQMWDSTTNTWVTVNLQVDFLSLPMTDEDITAVAREAYKRSEAEAAKLNPEAAATAVEADNAYEYYTILGVERTADAREVKKSFAKRALEMHPDKNVGDPNATKKFQLLNEAYQTLSNPELRARYDLKGTIDPNEVSVMENGSPLEELLGAEHLRPLIGRVEWLMHFAPGMKFTDELKAAFQARRKLRVAKQLVRFLDEDDGFAVARSVLMQAAETRCGPEIVAVVAECYRTVARQHLHGNSVLRELDGFFSARTSELENAWEWMSTNVGTVYKTLRKNLGEDDMLRFVLANSLNDIQKTVSRATKLVVFDISVSPEARHTRMMKLDALSKLAMETVRERCVAMAREKEIDSASPPTQAS